MKRCKGCHGFNDEAHTSIPMGADRCTRDHDERCSGGIIGGPDSKGREWRACPDAFISSPSKPGQAFSDDVAAVSEPSNTDIIPGSLLSLTTSPAMSVLTTTVSGSQSHSLSTPTVTTSSSQQAPLLSSQIQTELAVEIAALDRIRAERKALEEQLALQAQQKLSAERLEIRRQLQAEQDRVQQIKSSTSASLQSSVQGAVGHLQSRGHDSATDVNCPNYYDGPNIRDIRKIPGLHSEVERVVDKVRENVPSLGRRPSAGDKRTGTRPKQQSQLKQHKSQNERDFEEYKQFCSWKAKFSPAPALSGSDSDASPPRAAAPSKKVSGSRQASGLHADPITDSSSTEDESPRPVVLVYRRNSNGVKYRSYEPYQVDKAALPPRESQHVWVTDEATGYQYKQRVRQAASSDRQASTATTTSAGRCVDHSRASQTPASGFKLGVRSPSPPRQRKERIPGIMPLSEKEGKIDDAKLLTIVDWVRNCPVAYAEKIKLDEVNLPLWVWGYVSEILSSRSGLSPDMPRGELEARLQHLLCVLQVALVHSEKTDFFTNGWSVASTYAKRVQQKLDRKLENWADFKRFGHDPHPSEMFSAKTEADRKAPLRKKKEGERTDRDRFDRDKSDQSKKLCTTWNNSEVQRKCQYMLDYPSARCIRRHECSYCSEKGHGVNIHQRRFCRKRLDAGED